MMHNCTLTHKLAIYTCNFVYTCIFYILLCGNFYSVYNCALAYFSLRAVRIWRLNSACDVVRLTSPTGSSCIVRPGRPTYGSNSTGRTPECSWNSCKNTFFLFPSAWSALRDCAWTGWVASMIHCGGETSMKLILLHP